MPEPSGPQVHIDQPLSDFSVACFAEDGAYVARQAFPAQNVSKQSGRYHIWTRSDLLRTEAKRRAPGARVALRDFAVSDAGYYVEVNAIGHAISEQDLVNADPGVALEEGIVRGLVQDLKIAEEVKWASVAFGTSGWGTNGAPSVTWENASSYPLKDIATAIRTIQYNTGRLANTIVCGAETWYSGLMNHSDIVDRLPDNAPRIVTGNFLANLLGIQRVLVATAGYNSATEGATASYSSILGDNCLILYVDPNPGLLSPTAGATFVWSGLEGMQSGMRVQREYIPVDDAMPLITVELAATPKIIASELGYNYYTCIT